MILTDAVNQRAAKPEIPHTTLELDRRGDRILHRKVRKAEIRRRPFADLAGEKIVRFTGAAHRGGDDRLGLHAWARDRQHGALDPRAEHGIEASISKVGEAAKQIV